MHYSWLRAVVTLFMLRLTQLCGLRSRYSHSHSHRIFYRLTAPSRLCATQDNSNTVNNTGGGGFGSKKPLIPATPFPSIDAYAKGKKLLDSTQQVDLAKLAAERKESAFESITYPSPFTIKIVGENTESFKQDVLRTLGDSTDQPPEKIPTAFKDSSGTKFISITATPVFSSASQILNLYKQLSGISGIKFVL